MEERILSHSHLRVWCHLVGIWFVFKHTCAQFGKKNDLKTGVQAIQAIIISKNKIETDAWNRRSIEYFWKIN